MLMMEIIDDFVCDFALLLYSVNFILFVIICTWFDLLNEFEVSINTDRCII